MSRLTEFRQQYPEYDDLNDSALLMGLHKAHYSDVPFIKFAELMDPPVEPSFMDKTNRAVSSFFADNNIRSGPGSVGDSGYSDPVSGEFRQPGLPKASKQYDEQGEAIIKAIDNTPERFLKAGSSLMDVVGNLGNYQIPEPKTGSDFMAAPSRIALKMLDTLAGKLVPDDTKQNLKLNARALRDASNQELQQNAPNPAPGLSQYVTDTTRAVADMAPMLATGSAPLALGGMSLYAGGSKYADYINQGKSPQEALQAGVVNALAEGISEKIPVSAILKKGGGKEWFESIFGEGAQEAFMSIFEQTYDNTHLKNMSLSDALRGINWKDAAYAAAIGAGTGATIKTASLPLQAANEKAKIAQQQQEQQQNRDKLQQAVNQKNDQSEGTASPFWKQYDNQPDPAEQQPQVDPQTGEVINNGLTVEQIKQDLAQREGKAYPKPPGTQPALVGETRLQPQVEKNIAVIKHKPEQTIAQNMQQLALPDYSQAVESSKFDPISKEASNPLIEAEQAWNTTYSHIDKTDPLFQGMYQDFIAGYVSGLAGIRLDENAIANDRDRLYAVANGVGLKNYSGKIFDFSKVRPILKRAQQDAENGIKEKLERKVKLQQKEELRQKTEVERIKKQDQERAAQSAKLASEKEKQDKADLLRLRKTDVLTSRKKPFTSISQAEKAKVEQGLSGSDVVAVIDDAGNSGYAIRKKVVEKQSSNKKDPVYQAFLDRLDDKPEVNKPTHKIGNSDFVPTHETSDGTPVIATEEKNVWKDKNGNEIEDDYASEIESGDTLPAKPLFQPRTEPVKKSDKGNIEPELPDDQSTSVAAKPIDTKPKKTVSKLRALAEKMETEANTSLGYDRKTHTARYARQAAHADEKANENLRIAQTMKNLADAIDSGDAKALSGISAKTHITTLDDILNRAKYNAPERLVDGRKESPRDRDASIYDIEFAEFPTPMIWGSNLNSIANDLDKIRGGKMLANKMRHLFRIVSSEGKYYFRSESDIELARKVLKKLKQGGDNYTGWTIRDPLVNYDRLQRIGIKTLDDLKAALREFMTYRDGKREVDKVKEAERSLAGKKIAGFFPTPKALGERMIEEAGIEDGMTVLEPSAGKGNLSDLIKSEGVSPDVIEPYEDLRTILQAKEYNLVAHDFLGFTGQYDRIIMNPPFEKNQDIAHVKHAFDQLKPGGRVVAIMSEHPFFANDKESIDFREWLEEQGGVSEKNPDGSFKATGEVRQTGVATRMVVIDKGMEKTPVEQVADEVQAKPKAKPKAAVKKVEQEQQKKPAIPLANTDDVGIEMGANRRQKGFSLSDIKNAGNDTERLLMAQKPKLWEKPDYQEMVDSGILPPVAHSIKQIYDSVSNKPAHKDDKFIYAYVEGVEALKNAVDEFLNNKTAQMELLKYMGEQAQKRSNRSFDILDQFKRDKQENLPEEFILDRVFPKNEKGNRWGRDNQAGNDRANAMGKKAYRSLRFSVDGFIKAIKAVEEGWPAKQEAWQRSYLVKSRDNALMVRSVKYTRSGEKWVVFIGGNKVEEFDTEAEANQYRDAMPPWYLLKKKYRRLVESFDTEAEARDAGRELVKKAKIEKFKEPKVAIEKSIREGRDNRDGKNVSTQDIMDLTGFKAVNFGNWMQGKSHAKERQAHANSIYDAVIDLAEVLNVPVKAISLNGMLSVAVGAQGRGNAAAHFVPGINDINITRTSGAGSLAHEFAHALDHYFGMKAGLSKKSDPFLSEYTYLPVKEGIRPEIVAHFKTIVDQMVRIEKPYTQEDIENSRLHTLKSAKESLQNGLNRIKTEKSSTKMDSLIAKLKQGDNGKMGKLGKSQHYVGANVDALREEYKKVNGRFFSLDNARWIDGDANNISRAKDAIEYHKKHPKTKTTRTDYYRNALGKESKSGRLYWSTDLEMFARAFEVYVMDKLAEKEGRNDYLTAAWKGTTEGMYGEEAAKRHPQGVEREKINRAFDALIAELKTEETGQGVALYSLFGESVIFDRYKTDGITIATIDQVAGHAEDILGFDIPFTIIERGDLSINVPMRYNLETGYIEVNSKIPLDKGVSTQHLVEEVMHGLDVVSPNKTISASSQFLDIKHGAVTKQVVEYYHNNNDELSAFLSYPLDPLYELSDTQIQAELFARLGVVYLGNPELLKRKLPNAFKIFKPIFPYQTSVKNGPVFRDIWGIRSRNNRKTGRKLRYGQDVGQITSAASRQGRESEGLGGIRKAIAKSTRGTDRGKTVTFNKLNTYQKKPQRKDKKPAYNQSLQGDADAAREEAAKINNAGEFIESLKGKGKEYIANSLVMLPRLALEEAGKNILPEISNYVETAQIMDADKVHNMEQSSALADEWRKYNKQPRHAEALAEIMHDATIEGVDPSVPYKSKFDKTTVIQEIKELERQAKHAGRMGGNQTEMEDLNIKRAQVNGDRARKEKYDALKVIYDRLPLAGKQLYRKVKKAHEDRWDEIYQALEDRINRADLGGKERRKMINELRLQFETQKLDGPYFPLARFGDYWVKAKKGKEEVFSLAESEFVAKRWVKQMQQKGYKASFGKKVQEDPIMDGASINFVTEVQNILSDIPGHTSNQVADAVNQLYLHTLPALSIRKSFIHRKKVAGFSRDVLRAFSHQMFHGAGQLAKLRYTDQLDDSIKQMKKEIEKSPDPVLAAAFYEEMIKRNEWAQNPKNAPWTALTSQAAFLWYLTTPAAGLINMTQTALVAYPELASRFGEIKASKELTRAMVDFMKGKGNIENALSGDERNAILQLIRDGVIDKTQAHTLAELADSDTTQYSHGKHTLMNAASFLFHHSERLNREVTAIAAYRLARQTGKSHDSAKKTARDVTYKTHFDYSNANRARFMQGDVMKMLTIFRQYSLNMTWLMLKRTYDTKFAKTAKERTQARRFIANFVAMSLIMSGTLGLPLVKQLLEMVQFLFGDDEDEHIDAETMFRQFLIDATGSKEAGELIAKGPMNVITGLDFHTRTKLTELWHRSPSKDLEGKAWWLDLMGQIAGPFWNIPVDMTIGAQMVIEGHYQRGIERMTPKLIGSMSKAGRFSTDGAETFSGDKLVEKFTTWEIIGQAFGFTPAHLAERYGENSSKRRAINKLQQQRYDLMNYFALFNRMGDDESKQKVIMKMREFSQHHPAMAINADSVRRSMLGKAKRSATSDHGFYSSKKQSVPVRGIDYVEER